MVDRHSGVVDDPVHYAEGVGLRYPAVIVDRTRPVAAARRVELIDRDHLARLRVGQQIVVMEAPPSGGIAAESAARERRIMTATRLYIQDPHREHITRLGIAHHDRAGAYVDAEPLAGAAPMNRRIDRPGATPVDILGVLGPKKDALRPRVSRDHSRMVVVSMMGQRFDGDEISRVDRQHRFERSAEITPMDRFGGSRDDMMVDPAGRPGMTVCRCHSCLPWISSWCNSCVLVAHAVDVATTVTGIALRMCCAPLFAACNGTAQQWTRVSSKVRAACRSKPRASTRRNRCC